ncbi:3-phosphoinositide dependent protein kinase-1 [Sarracenia purpurea var. burkii]
MDFVLSYAKNGELLPYINKVGSFDLDCTKFYSGEILVALEYLHNSNVIHRDLKPENILLDENMHIMITDFGSATMYKPPNERRCKNGMSNGCGRGDDDDEDEPRKRKNSFVGTAQYVSPELLTDKPVLDSDERLGAKDTTRYSSIRSHPFYEGLDFDTLQQTTPPQIYPYLPGRSSNSQELRSHYRVPDHLEPGLNDKQLTRLLGLDIRWAEPEQPPQTARPRKKSGVMDLNAEEIKEQLDKQKRSSKWDSMVQGNLILKQGLIDKRKPNRTYYLEDPEGYALDWCKAIEEVRISTYGADNT